MLEVVELSSFIAAVAVLVKHNCFLENYFKIPAFLLEVEVFCEEDSHFEQLEEGLS